MAGAPAPSGGVGPTICQVSVPSQYQFHEQVTNDQGTLASCVGLIKGQGWKHLDPWSTYPCKLTATTSTTITKEQSRVSLNIVGASHNHRVGSSLPLGAAAPTTNRTLCNRPGYRLATDQGALIRAVHDKKRWIAGVLGPRGVAAPNTDLPSSPPILQVYKRHPTLARTRDMKVAHHYKSLFYMRVKIL
jgi:hypothetical protein